MNVSNMRPETFPLPKLKEIPADFPLPPLDEDAGAELPFFLAAPAAFSARLMGFKPRCSICRKASWRPPASTSPSVVTPLA